MFAKLTCFVIKVQNYYAERNFPALTKSGDGLPLPGSLSRIAGLCSGYGRNPTSLRPGCSRTAGCFLIVKPWRLPKITQLYAGPECGHPVRRSLRCLSGQRCGSKFYPLFFVRNLSFFRDNVRKKWPLQGSISAVYRWSGVSPAAGRNNGRPHQKKETYQRPI